MISESDHLAGAIEHLTAIREDLDVIPITLEGRRDQSLKHIEWLHLGQEGVLGALEEEYVTLKSLTRLIEARDAPEEGGMPDMPPDLCLNKDCNTVGCIGNCKE